MKKYIMPPTTEIATGRRDGTRLVISEWPFETDDPEVIEILDMMGVPEYQEPPAPPVKAGKARDEDEGGED